MLSSFAFRKTAASIKSACFRAGVEVVELKPAYTSVIGAVNLRPDPNDFPLIRAWRLPLPVED